MFRAATARSGRACWQRVLEARHQARADLGRGPVGGDRYGAPLKRKASTPTAPPPAWNVERPADRPDEAVRVLALGEASARLGISQSALEAMIEAGEIDALPTGYTRMIPTREIERLVSRPTV
jgi:excisionase family DNA binding protein